MTINENTNSYRIPETIPFADRNPLDLEGDQFKIATAEEQRAFLVRQHIEHCPACLHNIQRNLTLRIAQHVNHDLIYQIWMERYTASSSLTLRPVQAFAARWQTRYMDLCVWHGNEDPIHLSTVSEMMQYFTGVKFEDQGQYRITLFPGETEAQAMSLEDYDRWMINPVIDGPNLLDDSPYEARHISDELITAHIDFCPWCTFYQERGQAKPIRQHLLESYPNIRDFPQSWVEHYLIEWSRENQEILLLDYDPEEAWEKEREEGRKDEYKQPIKFPTLYHLRRHLEKFIPAPSENLFVLVSTNYREDALPTHETFQLWNQDESNYPWFQSWLGEHPTQWPFLPRQIVDLLIPAVLNHGQVSLDLALHTLLLRNLRKWEEKIEQELSFCPWPPLDGEHDPDVEAEQNALEEKQAWIMQLEASCTVKLVDEGRKLFTHDAPKRELLRQLDDWMSR